MSAAQVHDPADIALERARWQRVLFAAEPSRLDLMRLQPAWPRRSIRIRVHRNHQVELAASAMRPYLAYAGFDATFDIGAYDDSLSFGEGADAAAADVHVVWVETDRYRDRTAASELAGWMAGRVRELRAATAAPILVADGAAGDPWTRELNAGLAAALEPVPGAHVCAVSELADALGERWIDARARSVAGTAMSDAASIAAARAFGCRWIPAVLRPRLKAIALDLDNTLYAGVLGEDGVAGVRLTEAHRALQARLVGLQARGVLLGVVSRNEAVDVDALFAEREDFPLRAAHLTAIVASWAPKAEGLGKLAGRLRIGSDAIALLDDNPGELAAAAAALPAVWTLHADDPESTIRALDWFPGLFAFRASTEDALRSADLQASRERDELAAAARDPEAYVRSLDVRLTFGMDPVDQAPRIHELSNKTNQFNTALRRMSEAEVAGRLADPASSVVTVGLQDRLSDSGIVGIVCMRRDPSALVVDEVCISCRALGRGVEDAIVLEAVAAARRQGARGTVEFAFRSGPRNGPARDWLARFGPLPDEGDARVSVPWERLAPLLDDVRGRVTVSWSAST